MRTSVSPCREIGKNLKVEINLNHKKSGRMLEEGMKSLRECVFTMVVSPIRIERRVYTFLVFKSWSPELLYVSDGLLVCSHENDISQVCCNVSFSPIFVSILYVYQLLQFILQ